MWRWIRGVWRLALLLLSGAWFVRYYYCLFDAIAVVVVSTAAAAVAVACGVGFVAFGVASAVGSVASFDTTTAAAVSLFAACHRSTYHLVSSYRSSCIFVSKDKGIKRKGNSISTSISKTNGEGWSRPMARMWP